MKHSKTLFLLFGLLICTACLSCSGWNRELAIFPVSDSITVPENGSANVVIKILLPRGQHIYGNPVGPGIGKPTIVTSESPSEVTVLAAQFLKPKKFVPPDGGPFVWVYEDQTTIIVPLHISSPVTQKAYPVVFTVTGLVCTESSCVPVKKSFTINVHIAAQNKTVAGLQNLGTHVSLPPSGSLAEDSLGVQLVPQHIASSHVSGIAAAILFALLAGFMLNFMPCVLPVVSLKVLGFVKHAHQNRRVIFLQGIFFSSGILVSFAVLASLAAFSGYSWGGLFQKEWFIISMAAIVFALALSMFDVFTLHIPSCAAKKSSQSQQNIYRDAFTKGLLATLLATPCSGPFLGGTLAWTMTQAPAVIFTIFICIGIGMSFPYVLLTAFPALIKKIPRGGSGTLVFERIMAFLLLATVVYLLDILPDQKAVACVWFLLFIGLAVWQYGRFGSLAKPVVSRVLSSIALIFIIVGGYFLSFDVIEPAKPHAAVLDAETFSYKKLLSNRDRGTVSVVQFTADWCPNCKVVESSSLYTERVSAELKRSGAELIKADITIESPAAESLLKELGSRSIPFLAVFPAGKNFNKPYCLRDMYYEQEVIHAVKKAREVSAP